MAFMMPVMKNDYNIYASRSRTSSNNSVSSSRRHTQSESAPVSLSSSPGSDVEERLAAISLGCSPRRGSRLHEEMAPSSTSRSASQSSLHKFHNKVVEKLRRKLRSASRDESTDGNSNSNSSNKQTTAAAPSS